MLKDKFPSVTFKKFLSKFSNRTQKIIDNIFSLTLKILFFKYKRKVREYERTMILRKKKRRKRKYHTGPLYLKEKDISNAISVVDFHLNNNSKIIVESNSNLVENFGKFPLEDALKYYDEFLIGSTVMDVFNREIIFTNKGKRFLYKEKTAEGKHIQSPENYVKARGKRLSWIKPLLKKTREIYRETESSWETFLYTGIFLITLEKNTPFERTVNNYFLIVTRKNRNKPIEFVTAYFMESQLELLKHLEKAKPLYIA